MKARQLLWGSSVSVVSIIATLGVVTVIKNSGPPVTGPKESKPVTINYKVNDAGTELEVTLTDPDGCKKNHNEKSGCFKIKNKKTGLIKYEFTASDQWELKRFLICQRETEITVTDPCTVDLTLNERLEFSVMENADGGKILVTPASGEVDLSQLPAGAALRTFYLFDQNTIQRKYVYSIEACDGDNCIRLDPPVENKGRD
jgi:hypothetical protein